MCLSVGYFLYDFVFCILTTDPKSSGLQMQTYGHHVLAIGGSVSAMTHAGFLGSVCQLSCITELSTFFVNFRVILAYHHIKTGIVYTVNGLMMCFSFFWVRAVFYSWIIFGPIVENCILRSASFWNLHEPW